MVQPQRIFVDTGAWFALQVTDDRYHAIAREVFPKLLKSYQTLTTTNHVIGETYTLLRTAKGFNAAWRFLETLEQSPRIQRIFVSSKIEQDAYSLLQQYSEHPFSFVDGISFCIMKKEAISHAFAFDRHFATVGFTRIPLDHSL